MQRPHSPGFIAARDHLLRLSEEDRMRLAGLFGAMADERPPPSGELLDFLDLLAGLEPQDRRRLAHWIRRYVSRWGQVPVAYSWERSRH